MATKNKKEQAIKVQVRRFGVLEMGNLFMVLYAFLAAFLSPIFIVKAIHDHSGVLEVLLMIVVYPLVGFVVGILAAVLYNLASKVIGGLKIELDVEKTGGLLATRTCLSETSRAPD